MSDCLLEEVTDLTPAERKSVDDFMPDDPPIENMTQLQVNFVDYLIINKGNKTQAYKDAGYKAGNNNSAAVSAHQLFKNAKVQKYFAWRLEQIRRATNMDVNQQRVVLELNRLAFSKISDVCNWDENGVITVKNVDDLSDDALASIKKIRCIHSVRTDKDGNETETTTLEIEQHDKKAALEILARASKLVGDTGAASAPIYLSLSFGAPPAEGKQPIKEVNHVGKQ